MTDKDMNQQFSIIVSYIKQHIEQQNGDPLSVQVLNLKNKKVPRIIDLKILPNLKIIDLRNSQISQMTGFQQCYKIEQLHLCENNISKIKRISHLSKLRLLDIRGNHMRDLNSCICQIPSSVQQIKARCNHIVNIEQVVKINNKLKVVWLDENCFVKSTKDFLRKTFLQKSSMMGDIWL